MSRTVSRAYQLTIRVTGPVADAVRQLAKRESLSLNQAVMRLLERGSGLDRRPGSRVGKGLDRFHGLLSDEEADAIDSVVDDTFGNVDPKLWK